MFTSGKSAGWIQKVKRTILWGIAMMAFVTLVWSVLPEVAAAAPGNTGQTDCWHWIELEDGKASITGFEHDWNQDELNLTVPASVGTSPDTLTVTGIGEDVFLGRTRLNSIQLPGTLKSIGDSAFSGCSSLTNITLPAGLESIGEDTFRSTGLTTITIPSSVTSISNMAFMACYDLENLEITDGLNPLVVGSEAFASCSSLSSAKLNRLSSVSSQMFSYCPALQSVAISDSVTSIASLAFGCNPGSKTGLTSIVIPDSVTSIGQSAFQYCSDLASVVLPENGSFTEIPSGLFLGCSSLNSVNIPPNITSIGGAAFAECGFTSFTIPDTVTSLGSGVFQGCESLASITLPINSITSVPDGLAGGCMALESISIPANMTFIGDGAFIETGFQTFTVPDHVTGIGEGAFNECEFLTSVTMSANVTDIGDYAFCECPLLTRVTIPGANVTLGQNVFTWSAITGGSLGSEDGIYGLSGSTVQTYALANGIPFHAIYSGNDSGSGRGSGESAAYKADVSGNGVSGSLPVTVNVSTGSATVDLSSQPDAFDSGGDTVINLPSISDVSSYTLGIPVAYLSQSDEKGALTLNTDTGSITLPANMLAGMEGKHAEINISQGDKSGLPDNVKELIGDRALVQLALRLDGVQTEWDNPGATVTVSIPYTPTAAELTNPEDIIVWYIDGKGNAVSVPNGRYDPVRGTMTFTTTHFSYYGVGYNQVSFNDVAATAWYNQAVSFIAARGIATGTGHGNYDPDAKLKRGDFLVLLMKSYAIAAEANLVDNFSDAGSTYYTGYLAAAKRMGITTGLGNNLFAPGKEITRQEMFTLLYNALKIVGKLPQSNAGNPLSSFSDTEQLAPWAQEAVTLLVEAGIISGSNGQLHPADTVSRAETAQALYKLLSK